MLKHCTCGRNEIMLNTYRVGVTAYNIVKYTAASLTVLQHSLPTCTTIGFAPQPIITQAFISNTLLSELIWHVLLRRSLNFCSCTTCFLDLIDLVRINKGSKSLSLTSKCQVSSERGVLDLESEVQGFSSHWGNILLLQFFVFM